MPPKLEEQEKEIGRRLREFREGLCVPQTRFAKKAGIDRQRLVALESGRGRLKWIEFLDIAEAWEINPGWLKTGKGERKTLFDFTSMPEDIEAGEAFSKVQPPTFSLSSEDVGEAGRKVLERHEDRLHSLVSTFEKMSARERLEAVMDARFSLGLESIETAVRSAAKARADAESVMARRIAKAERLFQEGKKKSNAELDTNAALADTSGVPSKYKSWPQLREAVKHLSGKRGGRKALAERFGVTRQTVHAWLKGTNEPSAEVVFQLLKMAEENQPT